METRFLRTLLIAVETGSIVETARRLNITPSAVTQRLKALEEQVGQPLLLRSGRHMQPTSAASIIVAAATQILDLEDGMRAAVSADNMAGLLQVGVIQTALTGLLPDMLVRLRGSLPNIELYLMPGPSGDLYAKVVDGQLDLAIIVKPHFQIPKSVEWLPLRREALLFISPPGIGQLDPKTMLRRELFIRYDRNHWGGRGIDQYLRQQRIRPREQYELDSLEAIVVMVSRGLGVSIIPDWPRPWPQNVRINQVILMDAQPREVGVLWSRVSRRLPLISRFLAEFRR